MRVRTPVGRLPWWAVVVGNTVFWPTWTLGIGYLAQRLPSNTFANDNWLTRARPFERDGGLYRDELAIHRWKDRLPEAGALFGGMNKRRLAAVDAAYVDAFVRESRRAEQAHWAMVSGVLLTLAWNPRLAWPINCAVAVASNAPCIAVQRYNRGRLQRVATYGRSHRAVR